MPKYSEYEMPVTIRYRARVEDSGDEHNRIVAAIEDIPGVQIVGDPDSCAVAFDSDGSDV